MKVLIKPIVSACVALGGTLASLPGLSQTPADTQATGRDFESKSVSKLGSLNADLLCEHLFDSADPAAMTVELARIVGPGALIGKFSEIAGQPASDQKKTYDRLRTLARQKVWLPVLAERKIGEWIDQKARKESKVVEAEGLPRAQRKQFDVVKSLLDDIVATLPADNPYKFSLSILLDDASNASISPGGFVYVTRGMLQDKTLDRNDLALRLAHEVAHLTRRHALKDTQVKVVDSLEVSKSIKPLLDFTQDPTKTLDALLGTMQATELMFQRFDQVQELEADACGTYLLTRLRGVDARAAVKRFAAARTGTPSGKGWDTSHPPPQEREMVMMAQIDPSRRAAVEALKPRRTGSSRQPSGRTVSEATSGGSTTSPPPVAEPAPTPGTNPVTNLFERVKRSLPAGSAPSPGGQAREGQ